MYLLPLDAFFFLPLILSLYRSCSCFVPFSPCHYKNRNTFVLKSETVKHCAISSIVIKCSIKLGLFILKICHLYSISFILFFSLFNSQNSFIFHQIIFFTRVLYSFRLNYPLISLIHHFSYHLIKTIRKLRVQL